MKYTLFIFLMLIATAIVKSDDHHAAQGGSRYSNSTYKFDLTPPDFGKSDSTVVTATFAAAPVDGFSANVNVMVQIDPSNRDKYEATTNRQIEQLDGQVISSKQLRVSNHDALRMEYSLTTNKKDMQFLSLAVFVDGKVYLTTCTDTHAQFESHRGEFEKCLDTFKVNP